jgi:hypothetical protein
MGWWFGSLGIDGFVNLDKIKKQTTPVNNEIVENKENKFKTTTIATRLVLFSNYLHLVSRKIYTYFISNNFA